jgi:hypothetical protein
MKGNKKEKAKEQGGEKEVEEKWKEKKEFKEITCHSLFLFYLFSSDRKPCPELMH